MKRINFISLLLSLCFCCIYSQNVKDNIVIGKYEGKVFEVVDSTECCIVLQHFSNNSNEESKQLNFYINIPKGVEFKRSIVSFNYSFIFENEDKESIVIEIFRDKNMEKQSSRRYTPFYSADMEERYFGFFINNESLVYYYNVKPEHNGVFSQSIKSIRIKKED